MARRTHLVKRALNPVDKPIAKPHHTHLARIESIT